jgi:tetratricopeptide (TPR) repeat protein
MVSAVRLRWAGFGLSLLTAVAPAAAQPQAPTAAEAFTIGRVLALEGDFRGALENLRIAVQREPDDPFVHLEMASLSYRVGRTDDAVTHARRALALAPDDADVLQGAAEVFLGLADERTELLAEGQQALERLLAVREDDPTTLHALGRLYQAKGETDKAEEMFRRLVAAEPGSRQASSQLLQMLMQSGKSREAAGVLADLVAADPNALELRLSLADLLGDTGDHAGALAVLRAAPAEQAENADLRRRLAFALYRSGDIPAASAILEPLLAANPRDHRLRLFGALLLEEQGRDAEAVAALQALHADQPADPEVALSLARLLARGERRDEARQLLSRLLDGLSGNDPEQVAVAGRVRVELAQIAALDERWEEVLELLAGLGDQTGNLRGAATLLRSEALVRLDRGEEALALLGPASGLPEETLRGQRAEVLLALDRDAEAEAEIAPLRRTPTGQRRAAEVYQRAGRHDLAVPLLETLVTGEPTSTELRFRLGAAYERSGQTPQAVDTFRGLLASAPDFHMALNYLGYMWAEKGENLPEALAMVRKALTFEPENPAYLDSLGWVYFQMGDYRRALEPLERAAVLMPGDGTVLEHLGDVQRALGKLGEARATYERALALEDDNAAAVRRKLEEVGREQPRR